MLKPTILAFALALGLAIPVRASELQRADPTTHRVSTALPTEVVEVQSNRPNPVGTIVGDAIGGAILGGAVGGGVALYNRYGVSNGTWNNWERDVLIGAGIGLGVGLIVGGISAASQSADRTYLSPATEHRDIGFSPPVGNYGVRF
jgi:hypothetical protein